jgi:hypothetical protein
VFKDENDSRRAKRSGKNYVHKLISFSESMVCGIHYLMPFLRFKPILFFLRGEGGS